MTSHYQRRTTRCRMSWVYQEHCVGSCRTRVSCRLFSQGIERGLTLRGRQDWDVHYVLESIELALNHCQHTAWWMVTVFAGNMRMEKKQLLPLLLGFENITQPPNILSPHSCIAKWHAPRTREVKIYSKRAMEVTSRLRGMRKWNG
jgi:hypothetical protein